MIDIEQKQGVLNISHYNKNGKIEIENIPIEQKDQFEWEYCFFNSKNIDPRYKSWDNRQVKKIRRDYLYKYRIEEILINLDQSTRDLIYTFNKPDVWFCDIETEISNDGFPSPDRAPCTVTAICLVNNNIVNVLGLKPLLQEEIDGIEIQLNEYFKKYKIKYKFTYIHHKSEHSLLYSFFNDWIPKISLLTGWNFIGFDWLYLINRAKKFNIDPLVSSPSRTFIGSSEIIPQHRPIIDYMEIYNKWDQKIQVKESAKLDYVAEQATGLKKIKYNGTLQTLYEKDFKKYIYYNIVDTILVKCIDKELETLSTYLQLANSAKVELIKAFSPIHMTEMLMLREFYKQDKIFVRKFEEVLNAQKSYSGAYVKDPIPGLYEWIATFDFASLYPSTMRQFNISPETYLGKYPIMSKSDAIQTASGAWFNNSKDSVTRIFLSNLYNQRVLSKSDMKIAEKKIECIKQIIKNKH